MTEAGGQAASETSHDPETGKPIAHPLRTVDEVWQWKEGHDIFNVATVPLSDQSRKLEKRPRTLVCHDMKGGYIEDRSVDLIEWFVQGYNSCDCYRIYHWQLIDVFVYFSHNFVTIPPPCWTNAGHIHGVPVLGTLITESDEGVARCRKFLKDRSSWETLVKQLVNIAEYYGFDGWFLNIETSMQAADIKVKNLEDFVTSLASVMHQRIPNSLVIWYDSVTDEGLLDYQNELNSKNKIFFDECDGIFLNYGWSVPDSLKKSADAAGQERQTDVYVGVDVFGRGCYGGGGYNCDKAFKVIREWKLSAALFAPGWVMETQGTEHFTEHQDKFWNLLAPYCTVHTAVKMTPFATSMCRGYGKTGSIDGKTVLSIPWTNLSAQQYQPTFNDTFSNPDDKAGLIISSVDFTVDEAYNGGGCQMITGCVNSSKETASGVVRLFKTDLPLKGPVLVSFTFKLCPDVSMNVALQLNTDTIPTCVLLCPASSDDQASAHSNESDSNKELIRRYGVPESRTLTSSAFMSLFGQEHCQLFEPLIGSFHDSLQQAHGLKEGRNDDSNWCTRHYMIAEEQGRKVQEVGVRCVVSPGVTKTTGAFKLYLGEIKIIDPQVLKQPIPLARNIRGLNIKWKTTKEGYLLSLTLMWHCPISDDQVVEPAYFNIFRVADGSYVFLGRAFVEAYQTCAMPLPKTCSSVEFVVQVVTRSGLKKPPSECSHLKVKCP